MLATLPLCQSIRLNDQRLYQPDLQAAIVLFQEKEDKRLTAAVQRLFPGSVWHSAPAAGGCPYTFRWGTDADEADKADEAGLEDKADLAAALEEIRPEGYVLHAVGRSARIFASDPAGLFYGMQTLRQLLDQEGAVDGDSAIPAIPATLISDWPDSPLRAMNYDLRQTFSKQEHLIGYLDVMASFKANALLIEYEDKFPYAVNPEFRHPRHALTDDQFEELKAAAARNFIEIIPLQQTFGHLELILRREEYKHLRETETSTGELCPCRPGSYDLVAGLVEEMAKRHPDSRYLHLGCDEVYSLCECPECRERFGGSRGLAFLYHVNRLVAFTCGLGKQPMIWQDVLAECSDEELRLLDPRVAVMIWHYNGRNVIRDWAPLAKRLQALGISVFGAPAVRCFDCKDDQNYPLVEPRLDNIEQWTQAASELQLDGLIGTNWTSTFSLGVPYGIFETSWYTMAYFADCSWSFRPEGRERFIDRFLQVFHGLSSERARELAGRYTNLDYYAVMPAFEPGIIRNRDIAELIETMLQFESASDRSRTTHKWVYRQEFFPPSEAERRSLLNNYQATRKGLERSRARMTQALHRYQPEDMAEHYIFSRYYLHDYLEKTLYAPMGLRLEPTEVGE